MPSGPAPLRSRLAATRPWPTGPDRRNSAELKGPAIAGDPPVMAPAADSARGTTLGLRPTCVRPHRFSGHRHGRLAGEPSPFLSHLLLATDAFPSRLGSCSALRRAGGRL